MLRRSAANLWIAVLCLIWGSTWIVIKGGLTDLPPFTSAAVRFLVAATAMTIATFAWSAREGGTRAPRWLSAVMGATNFAGSYAIVYWSETRLPSGIVALLWSVFPLLMAISGHFFLAGEALRRRQWLGFAIAFAGVGLLFATDLAQFGEYAISSALVLFVSPLISAVGTTLVKRHGAGVSSLALNRDAMWFGAVLLSALALWQEREVPVHWTGSAIVSVAYLAIFGTAVTFGLYFWLLRETAAHRMSLIAYVTPAIALLLGALFGETPISRYTLAGSALILLGVALVVRGRHAPPRDVAPAREPARASSSA